MSKIKKITCLIVITIGLIPLSGYSENRALLVGVGNYQFWPKNLPGIREDLSLMNKTAQYLGFKTKQIKILQGKEANYEKLKEVFHKWLIKDVSEEDRVLFYFTGHGTQIPDNDGDEIDQADEALVLYDAQLSASGKELYNVLRDDDMAKMLEKIPSNNILLLVDACHNGTTDKSFFFEESMDNSETGAVSKFFEYPGMPYASLKKPKKSLILSQGKEKYVIITAAADDEKALTTKEGSLFTQGIYAVISESITEKQTMTIKILQDRVSDYVKLKVIKNHLGAVHHPQLGGNLQRFNDVLSLSGDL